MTRAELVAEVLRLDGEATDGPWFVGSDNQYGINVSGIFSEHRNTDSVRTLIVETGGEFCDLEEKDADAIAFYRTAAPRLARDNAMLRARADWLLARIVTEEWPGHGDDCHCRTCKAIAAMFDVLEDANND